MVVCSGVISSPIVPSRIDSDFRQTYPAVDMARVCAIRRVHVNRDGVDLRETKVYRVLVPARIWNALDWVPVFNTRHPSIS